jgi:hypothetical protein
MAPEFPDALTPNRGHATKPSAKSLGVLPSNNVSRPTRGVPLDPVRRQEPLTDVRRSFRNVSGPDFAVCRSNARLCTGGRRGSRVEGARPTLFPLCDLRDLLLTAFFLRLRNVSGPDFESPSTKPSS